MKRYTKAHLERIVAAQYENLNAIHDLLKIMKTQNELLEKANKKLRNEVIDFEVKYYKTGKMGKPEV